MAYGELNGHAIDDVTSSRDPDRSNLWPPCLDTSPIENSWRC